MPPLEPRLRIGFQRRTELKPVFLYFLIAGMATVMLGPALPLLAVRWHLRDAQLGTLFLAFFAGQICGSWVGARRLAVSLLLGTTSTAIGLTGLAYSGVTTAHFLLFIAGLGLGAGLTAGNVIVGNFGAPAVHDMENRTGAVAASTGAGQGFSRSKRLAWLNVSWGLGAIACPFWLRSSIHLERLAHRPPLRDLAGGDGKWFFLGMGIAFAASAILIFLLLPRRLYPPAQLFKGQVGLSWRAVWVFVATLVLYVGVENSLGGWLPIYAQRHSASGSMAGIAASVSLCFYIAELSSRGVMALTLKRRDETLFYRGCLLVLVAAFAALVLLPNPGTPAIFAMTAIAAASLSPLFPLAVSFLLARTGNHPQVGKVFASASLGGTCLPWFTGVISSHARSLRFGFAAPAIAALLILLLSRFLPASVDSPLGGAVTDADI